MQLTTPFKSHALSRLLRLRQNQFLCDNDQKKTTLTSDTSQSDKVF